jgi:hypothetical protein
VLERVDLREELLARAEVLRVALALMEALRGDSLGLGEPSPKERAERRAVAHLGVRPDGRRGFEVRGAGAEVLARLRLAGLGE